jgi:hypothetical protein
MLFLQLRNFCKQAKPLTQKLRVMRGQAAGYSMTYQLLQGSESSTTLPPYYQYDAPWFVKNGQRQNLVV